jgi:hypothetical protein
MTKPTPILMAKSRERMPNHRFYATLRRVDDKHLVAKGVLCEVYLPDSHRGDIEVIFHPKAEHIPALQFVNPISLYARSREGRFVLKSTEIWHDGATTGMQDGIAFVYPCKGRATNFEIRNLLANSRSKVLKGGAFWLTECPLINTAMTIMHFYTGNVRAKQIVKPTFALCSGVRLFFRKHFSSDSDTGDQLAQLVAEFKPKKRLATKSLKTVIDDLDDMLLLVSFAARRRCICTGWTYSDEEGNLVRFYRRTYVLPPKSRWDIDECLISIRSMMKFLRTAYASFGRASHKELIRNAIYALTHEGGTLDNQFLRLFAGLESVLLHVQGVKQKPGLKFLKEKVHFFQTVYNVDLTDLWPLLDRSSGTSLAQIRNRSIHGEYLNEASYRALTYATYNLRWTLERMLLSVLGWPIADSNVSKSFLPNLRTYRWQPTQSKI